jgi:hypothetical protein
MSMAAASTATQSPWVPLWAAAIGAGAAVAVGAVTQWWTSRRQKQQWAVEREDRQQQWERERQTRQEQWQREDSQRWLQNRQQAYAQLIAAISEWDDVLDKTRFQWDRGEKADDAYAAALKAVAQAMPLVEFMAPSSIAALAGKAKRARENIWQRRRMQDTMAKLEREQPDMAAEMHKAEERRRAERGGGIEADLTWMELESTRRDLVDAMRRDVELETRAAAAKLVSV